MRPVYNKCCETSQAVQVSDFILPLRASEVKTRLERIEDEPSKAFGILERKHRDVVMFVQW